MRVSPCKDCPERFLACSDRCPKDARGEYGYKTWRAERDAELAAARLKDSIDFVNSKSRSTWMRSR